MQEYEKSQTTPTSDSNEVSAMTSDSYNDPELDDLYPDAVKFVTASRIASIAALQKYFKHGYNRASAILVTMALAGTKKKLF